LVAVRMLFGGEEEPVACPSVGSLENALCKLDNGERAEGSLDPPRAHGRSCAKDSTVAVDEHDIDRELHEESVDAVTRREDQRAIGRQA